MKALSFLLSVFAFWLAVGQAGAGIVSASNARGGRAKMHRTKTQIPRFRPGMDIDQLYRFEDMQGIPDFSGREHAAPAGVVAASNDANFSSVNLSQPLTDYVVALIDDEGIADDLNELFPAVPVGRSFSYLISDLYADFQIDSNDDDIREIGGEFKELRPKGTQTTGRTDNKGLFVKIDNDMGGKEESVRQHWIRILTDRLYRTDLYRGSVILANGAVATTTASYNWGPSGTPWDPDGNISTLLLESAKARGTNANRVVMTGDLWQLRFLALGLATNPALTSTRTMTPEQVAAVLRVDKISVLDRRYQDTMNNSANTGTKKQVLDGAAGGTLMFAMRTEPNVNPMDPTNIKRFTSACDGGGPMRVYMEEKMKYTIIGVEHYSKILLTTNIGLKKTTITNT